MSPPKSLLIGWKISSTTAQLASVRYRALLPACALEKCGVRHRVFSKPEDANLDGLDALVIVKGLTAGDVSLAQRAASRGLSVIFDLCDNIFIDTYLGKSGQCPAAMFRAMLPSLSLVVVTTEPLAQVVRRDTGDRLPVRVIPDGLETAEQGRRASVMLASLRRAEKTSVLDRLAKASAVLRRKLASFRTTRARAIFKRVIHKVRGAWHEPFSTKRFYRVFDALRRRWRARRPQTPAAATDARRPNFKLVWFGNHGAAHAQFGMLDLLLIRRELEAIAASLPVELVVISNHREKFDQHIAPMAITSRYLEWSPQVVEQILATASVALVPNSVDEFSICKSANRTALALSRGVPVVAKMTPAVTALATCIEHSDFEAGIRRYLTDPAHAKAHIAEAKTLIEREFGDEAISRAWLEAIIEARDGACKTVSNPRFIVSLNLMQDLDLAVPVIEAAVRRSIDIEVWHSLGLVEKSPRVLATLTRLGVPTRALPDNPEAIRFPASAEVLLSIAETNLAPHRFSRILTEAAHAQGLRTATMQHGLENVGLTFDDDIQAIDKINFAAQRIYLWGELSSLHPRVTASVRDRCMSIGCTKPARIAPPALDHLLPAHKTVVGVFENLHWHRYDKAYREFFLRAVQELAEAFPAVIFLIKPHHGGLWLTRRHQGERPLADNVIIADPQAADWEPYTTPSLLGRLSAVITTPSTVALDAARHDVPVALIAPGLGLDHYAPLTRICNVGELLEFIRASLKDASPFSMLNRTFVQRVLVTPESAAGAMVDDLIQPPERPKTGTNNQ